MVCVSSKKLDVVRWIETKQESLEEQINKTK
jgi:hypothetical protein